MSRRSDALHAAAGLPELRLPTIPPCRCFTARPKAADPVIQAGERCSLVRSETAKHQAAGLPDPITWHVAVTNIGWEVSVRRQMTARGIDTVLPVIRTWRVHHRKRIAIEKPLLPRYLLFGLNRSTQSLVKREARFVRVGDRFERVEGADHRVTITGLERIVKGAAREWASIPAEDVYALRYRLLRGEFDPTAGPASDFIWWLAKHESLRPEDIVSHKAAKGMGLKFNVAA